MTQFLDLIFSSYFPFCELKKAIFQNLSIQLMGCMISEADYWLTRQDCSTMNDSSKRALQLIYYVLRVVVFKLFSFRKLVKLINATSCYLTVKEYFKHKYSQRSYQYCWIFWSIYFHQATRLVNLKNRRSWLAESCGGNSK